MNNNFFFTINVYMCNIKISSLNKSASSSQSNNKEEDNAEDQFINLVASKKSRRRKDYKIIEIMQARQDTKLNTIMPWPFTQSTSR